MCTGKTGKKETTAESDDYLFFSEYQKDLIIIAFLTYQFSEKGTKRFFLLYISLKFTYKMSLGALAVASYFQLFTVFHRNKTLLKTLHFFLWPKKILFRANTRTHTHKYTSSIIICLFEMLDKRTGRTRKKRWHNMHITKSLTRVHYLLSN